MIIAHVASRSACGLLLLACGAVLACTGGRADTHATVASSPASAASAAGVLTAITPHPSPPTPATQAPAATAPPSTSPLAADAGEPTRQVRLAVRVLVDEYVTPLDPAQLFTDAW